MSLSLKIKFYIDIHYIYSILMVSNINVYCLSLTAIKIMLIFRITQKIQKKLPTYTLGEDDIVAEGLAKREMVPALEFVKAVCKVNTLIYNYYYYYY